MAEQSSVEAFRSDPGLYIVDGGRCTIGVDPHFQEALAAYNALHPQERAFLRHLCANRLDGDTALVFADWLEENGRDDAGRMVRLLRPQPTDTLVVCLDLDREIVDPDYRNTIRQTFGVAHVLFVGQGQDIRLLSPEDMRALGWVRVENWGEGRAP